uniref:39S ribosomal protein L39 n=1 Tax=Schistocephalus solidus TaxID=70667 RepID=A0A0X3NSD8_SCHSO
MTLRVFRRTFSHNLVDVTRLVNAAEFKDYPSYVFKQSKRWWELKNGAMRSSMTPNVQRIDVAYTGYPKSDAVLSMAKGISTPHDCAKHLSQLLQDRSVLALVNGMPHDMHRPLTCECNLDFIHFKDVPTSTGLRLYGSQALSQ